MQKQSSNAHVGTRLRLDPQKQISALKSAQNAIRFLPGNKNWLIRPAELNDFTKNMKNTKNNSNLKSEKRLTTQYSHLKTRWLCFDIDMFFYGDVTIQLQKSQDVR